MARVDDHLPGWVFNHGSIQLLMPTGSSGYNPQPVSDPRAIKTESLSSEGNTGHVGFGGCEPSVPQWSVDRMV